MIDTIDIAHKIISISLILPTLYSLKVIQGKPINVSSLSFPKRLNRVIYIFMATCAIIWFFYITIDACLAIPSTLEPFTVSAFFDTCLDIVERVGELAIYYFLLKVLIKNSDMSDDNSNEKKQALVFLLFYMTTWFLQVFLFPLFDWIKYSQLIKSMDEMTNLATIAIIRPCYTIFMFRTIMKLAKRYISLGIKNSETKYEDQILLNQTSPMISNEPMHVDANAILTGFLIALGWIQNNQIKTDNVPMYILMSIMLLTTIFFGLYTFANWRYRQYTLKGLIRANRKLFIYSIGFLLTLFIVAVDKFVDGDNSAGGFEFVPIILTIVEVVMISTVKITSYVRIPVVAINIAQLYYNIIYNIEHIPHIAEPPHEFIIQYIVQTLFWISIDYHLVILVIVSI